MPSNSVDFRAICGTFYWTFLNFMQKRVIQKLSKRVRVIRLSAPMALFIVFIVGFLLRSGDVESNPGPPKNTKQSTLTSQLSSESPGREKKDSVSERSLDDVMKLLAKMDKKMDSIQTTMLEQNEKLQNDVIEVMKENSALKEKVDKLEAKVDDLEGRSRRKNLIFYGIPAPKGPAETWEECEAAVKNVLKEKMGIEEDIEMERVHRLKGKKTPPAVIVAFEKYKDKERVLAERKKLKDSRSNIFITEDFSLRVREKRRQLLPFMKEARAAQKRAYLRFDSLNIEGKSYVYDPVSDGIKERHGQR